MDSIEQAMRERASELEAITGGQVIVHCEMFISVRGQPYFTWYASVKGGQMDGTASMNNSFNELKNALQKKCDDKRAAMAKEVADRVAERRSAELYDVIYAGG